MNANIKPNPRGHRLASRLANRVSRAQKQRALTLIERINQLDRRRDQERCEACPDFFQRPSCCV